MHMETLIITHTLPVLVRVIIVVMKHHSQKQLGKERV